MNWNVLFLVTGWLLMGCDSPVAPAKPSDMEFHGPLSCDFSREHSLSCLSPAGRDNGFAVVYMGQFKVTVKLPHGRVFEGDAFLVTAQKSENNQIKMFHITTAADTLDSTCDLAKKIIADWDLKGKGLEEWKGHVAANPDYGFTFDAMNNAIHPSYSLAIRRSYVDGKPWCLFLEIHWP